MIKRWYLRDIGCFWKYWWHKKKTFMFFHRWMDDPYDFSGGPCSGAGGAIGRRVLKNINSSGGTWGHHGTPWDTQAEMGTPLTPSIPCIPAALPDHGHLSIDDWLGRHFPRPILVQEIPPFCINPHVKKTWFQFLIFHLNPSKSHVCWVNSPRDPQGIPWPRAGARQPPAHHFPGSHTPWPLGAIWGIGSLFLGENLGRTGESKLLNCKWTMLCHWSWICLPVEWMAMEIANTIRRGTSGGVSQHWQWSVARQT